MAELRDRAQAAHLADDIEWHALLHYRPDRFGSGFNSPALSDSFFFAPNGRSDPAAELDAVIDAFADEAAVVHGDEHPQCAFPARYLWLKKKLDFDPGRLRPQPCPRFDEWLTALAPAGISLIFPEAYMNSPASMFGHTLLRIDGAGRSDLLAYTINFSANTGNDGGVPFAWKGIVGSYQGLFSIHPYYETVKLYGDWENRDIWEYQLAFSATEIDLLLRHLWELRDVAFYYYFFDDNCSYQLLSLLLVARPEADLRQRLNRPWIIPADTVRAAADTPGLVSATRYRPSSATELRHRAGSLPRETQHLARDVADGARSADDPALARLDDESRAAALTVAYDRVRFVSVEHHGDTAASAKLSRQILLARSQVPVAGEVVAAVPTPELRPDEGHRSARLAAVSGWRNDRFYLEARIRPAFHDLLDPGGGYTTGAQIRFMELAGRVYPTTGQARVQELTLLDIVSLAPRDLFFHPIAWKFATGMDSRLLPKAHESRLYERQVWHSNGGAGLAYEPFAGSIAYGFADATLDVGPQLEDKVAFGPGLSIGLFGGPRSDRWKSHLFARVTRYALGDRDTAVRTGVQERLTLTRQMALRAEVAYVRNYSHDQPEASLAWEWFF